MSLEVGGQIELAIDKAVSGGRMIARHDGQVVLVDGAIPGERVLARMEKVERRLAFADVVEVLDRSPDRVPTGADRRCGGCLYAHIAYPRQLTLKAAVLRESFARLARLPLELPAVAASPVSGYRLRARLHVRGAEVGFYREGTHELCDAAGTGQLSDGAVAAAAAAVSSLAKAGHTVASVELTENLPANERVLLITLTGTRAVSDDETEHAVAAGRLTGCTVRAADGSVRSAGVPVVADALATLTAGRASGTLERHAASFFQANRFLLPQLVTAVLEAVPQAGEVVDLYSGVGLFAVALAGSGRRDVTAVEGDRTSAQDLLRNVAANGASVRVSVAPVEHFMRRTRTRAAALIVDPPRTGVSREAMPAIVSHGADRIIYVSCDPPTMARDARKLVDGGYRLLSLTAFDLFPQTPHVEALGLFERA